MEGYVSTTLNVLGTFNELPTTGNVGDVCVVGGEIYIYGVGWQKVSISAYETIKVEFEDRIKIENGTLYLT